MSIARPVGGIEEESESAAEGRQNMKQPNKTDAVAKAINETISKFTQMRELLCDPVISALVNEIVQIQTPSVRAGGRSPNAGARWGIVGAASRIIQEMDDEPFTKNDLAEKLRHEGYDIDAAKNSLYYPLQKLMAEHMIERIRKGGGKRADTYQKVKTNRNAKVRLPVVHGQVGEGGGSGSALPRQIRPRNAMELIASDCVARFDQPFAAHELIRDMKAAGHTFVGSADLSIQGFLGTLLKKQLLEIVEDSDGLRPAIYRRRNAE
jgi:hypothetical protein